MTSGIRFENVSVAYGRHGETTALDSLDLTVEPGEFMALLGPSGSGKTTALRAVAGFVQPVSGRVFIGGRDVTGLPPYLRGIGMVVQQYALFPHMRVKDNVAFGLQAQKAAKRLKGWFWRPDSTTGAKRRDRPKLAHKAPVARAESLRPPPLSMRGSRR